MPLESVFAELLALERGMPAAELEATLTRWDHAANSARAALLDAIGRHLAHSFHDGTLTYGQCDLIANILFSAAIEAGQPPVFWEVYLALDEGEYHHKEDRSDDPVEDYTRPLIAAFVARDRSTP